MMACDFDAIAAPVAIGTDCSSKWIMLLSNCVLGRRKLDDSVCEYRHSRTHNK